MEIDKIIEDLNKKIDSGNFKTIQLTKVEKAFLETYQPEKVLIVYGSLQPNAPNHHIVEHIKGEWKQGIVKGKLEQYGWGVDLGYYAFKHVSEAEQTDIKAYMLFSDELESNWQYLDEFEGENYKRILAKYELQNGQIGVGNIYAMNE